MIQNGAEAAIRSVIEDLQRCGGFVGGHAQCRAAISLGISQLWKILGDHSEAELWFMRSCLEAARENLIGVKICLLRFAAAAWYGTTPGFAAMLAAEADRMEAGLNERSG